MDATSGGVAAYKNHGDDTNPLERNDEDDMMLVVDEDEGDDNGDRDDDEYCEVVDDLGCLAIEDRSKNDQDEDNRWIRIQKGPEEDVQRMRTKQDVLREIERVRKEQAEFGPSELYPRSWQATGQPPRPVVNGDGKMTISVVQFNALAEGLSSGSVPTPFPTRESTRPTTASNRNSGGGSENEFGGFTKIKSPEVCLDFSLRRWRLAEVILQQYITSGNDESTLFDIIGMQEVDRFHGFFDPILQLFGYEGRFLPKPIAPGVRNGWYSDGCALFWKKSVFEIVSERSYNYDVGNQVLFLATLQHKPSKKLFVVAVTHLKAQRNPTMELVRCAQVKELLRCVTDAVTHAARLRQKQRSTSSLIDEYIPVLILGDLNADPPCRISGVKSSVRKLLNHRISANQQNRLSSAYPVDPPNPKFYTTWKTRGNKTVKRIIDYIFYGSGGLSCTSLLQVPEGDELEEGRLPGLRYPSDHMMIAAKFEF